VNGKRVIRIGTKIIVAFCLILIAALAVLPTVIEKKIRQQFTDLSPALDVKFASLHLGFFSSSISFDRLSLTFTPYENQAQHTHRLDFSTAVLSQTSFFKFLFSKNLVAKALILEDGKLQLDQFLLERVDSLQLAFFQKIAWPFKKLAIRNVELKHVKAFLHSEENDQLVATGDLKLAGIRIDRQGAVPAFSGINLTLSNIDYQFSGYKLRADVMAVNSAKKVVEIKTLRLIPTKGSREETRISSIRATGFNLANVLDSQELNAKKIVIDKSRIVIDGNKVKPRSLPFNLKGIHADICQIRETSIRYTDGVSKCTLDASVTLEELNIHKLFDKNNFHFSSLYGSFSGIRYSGDAYRDIEIKSLEADNGRIQVTDLKVVPRIGKYEFGRRLHHQADWVQAHIPEIQVFKPEINQLFYDKLFAEKITISKARIYLFRDRRLPRRQQNIPLPVAYIKTFPLDIRIKTLELANSSVAYEEYPREGYGQTGILRIETINATVSPLINHPVASDPASITMQVKGSIMGSGIVSGRVIMPLQRNKPYHVKGAIEKLELTKLNSSSENLGKIRIKSGFLDLLSFDFIMTDERSAGKIVGAYHNLVIQQLKKHTEEKNVANFASFMLRHLIIPLNKDKSLPERKRTGFVDYPRDPTRFVSHYFLQSLLMGVKKSFTLGFLLPK